VVVITPVDLPRDLLSDIGLDRIGKRACQLGSQHSISMRHEVIIDSLLHGYLPLNQLFLRCFPSLSRRHFLLLLLWLLLADLSLDATVVDIVRTYLLRLEQVMYLFDVAVAQQTLIGLLELRML